MDVNDLTVGQVKQLSSMLGATPKNTMLDRYVGKYVIVRSRNEGINAGEVVAIDSSGVVIKNARRIWWHKPKDNGQSWYEGVANTGLHKDSKLSPPVGEKAIVEAYGITTCTDVARMSIEGHPNHVG